MGNAEAGLQPEGQVLEPISWFLIADAVILRVPLDPAGAGPQQEVMVKAPWRL